MKKNERKLLILAGVLFAAVLVVRAGPLVIETYREDRQEIALLEERIERYRELIEEADQWRERVEQAQEEVAELEGWTFSGTNPNLIGSSVQRELRRAAESADLNLREMGVSRFARVDGWLMVHQEMSFTIAQEDILQFLSLLEESRPRLFVTEFSINRNRRGFTGDITVTGFSRGS